MVNKKSTMSIRSELIESNDFFDYIVDMIPETYYCTVQKDDDDGGAATNHKPSKYHKGQSKDSKEAKNARSKISKRAKFDHIQASKKQKKQNDDNDDDDDDKSNSAESDNNNENTNKELLLPTNPTLLPKSPQQKRQRKKQKKGNHNKNNAMAVDQEEGGNNNDTNNSTNKDDDENPKQSRIEMLRAKLEAKIVEKTGKRPMESNGVSKRAARKAEKKRRKEAAISKNKKSHSKVPSGGNKSSNNENNKLTTSNKNNNTNDAALDLESMDFGKLIGLNGKPSNDNYEKTNKSLANLSKKKNYEKILADAEEKQATIEQLKKSTDETDKAKLQKYQWTDAFKEASGARVKDDPAKIRNAIKKKQAKKKKSAKAWKSRTDKTKDDMSERQKIRNHNLQQRMVGGKTAANLSKKEIKKDGDTASGGRSGYEGKKDKSKGQ